MIVESFDRTGNRRENVVSDELTDKEALERLGLYKRPFTVNIWPNDRPDLARRVQTFDANPEGNTITSRL